MKYQTIHWDPLSLMLLTPIAQTKIWTLKFWILGSVHCRVMIASTHTHTYDCCIQGMLKLFVQDSPWYFLFGHPIISGLPQIVNTWIVGWEKLNSSSSLILENFLPFWFFWAFPTWSWLPRRKLALLAVGSGQMEPWGFLLFSTIFSTLSPR